MTLGMAICTFVVSLVIIASIIYFNPRAYRCSRTGRTYTQTAPHQFEPTPVAISGFNGGPADSSSFTFFSI